MRETIRKKSAQAVLEYAILLAIVAAAFLAMAFYARRSVQGRIYTLEGMSVGKDNTSHLIYSGGW